MLNVLKWINFLPALVWITIALTPLSVFGGAISGQIKTVGGDPIAGICVHAHVADQVCGGDWKGVGTTGDDGVYEISVPTGSYIVYTQNNAAAPCNLNRFIDKYWDGDTGDFNCTNSVPVVVANGQTRSDIHFELPEKAVLSGQVLDVLGDPIEGVCVKAGSQSQPCGVITWAGTGTTDADGAYTIPVEAGSLYVYTENNGAGGCGKLGYTDEWWDGANGSANCGAAVEIEVAAGGQVPSLDFVLNYASSIRGSVATTEDTPVVGACVNVVTADQVCGENWVAGVQTDAAGEFVLSIAPGTYYVYTVTDKAPCALNVYRDKWWDGATGHTDCTQATQVTVEQGAPANGIDFRLPSNSQNSRITGTVTVSVAGHTDLVVKTATISLKNTAFQTHTNDTGSFSLTEIPPGIYTLQVSAPDLKTMTRLVSLSAGETLQLDGRLKMTVGYGTGGDIDGNGTVGLEEAIHALEVAAEIR